MKWILVTLATGALFAAGPEPPRHHPVLVELFTSEGCSSCPPADALLEKLDSPEVIVLSEHVDYWNDIGWKDQYSSPVYSERQKKYAQQFYLNSVYTPQMVIDGVAEVVGNDNRAVRARIAAAGQREKIPVRMSSTGPDRIRIEVDANSNSNADVMLAVASNEAVTDVRSGENGGSKLHHVAVVRSITSIGTIRNGEVFSKEIPLKQEPGQRIIAWVQVRGQGPVLGSAIKH